jgi:cell division protein FtsL
MTSTRIRLADKIKQGNFMISILIIIVSLILTWFAISYQNQNATNGYKIKKLQEKRSEFLFQIENLEMEIADLGSIKNKEEVNKK